MNEVFLIFIADLLKVFSLGMVFFMAFALFYNALEDNF